MPPDTLHNRLIAKAVAELGWRTGPWRKEIRKRFREKPWAGDGDDDPEFVQEIIDMTLELRVNPDGWRLREEGPAEGWGHQVLVLEFLEVEVTHHVSDNKLSDYETLWWRFDATDKFHLNVYRMDRFGLVAPLVTEGTIQTLLARHRLQKGLPE